MTDLIDHAANGRRVVAEYRLVAPAKPERADGPAVHNARAGQTAHQLNGEALGPLRGCACHRNRTLRTSAGQRVRGGEGNRGSGRRARESLKP